MQDQWQEDIGDMDIAAINGDTTCNRSGKWGHVSKDCTTQKKGKAKEKLGKAKAKGQEEETSGVLGKAGAREKARRRAERTPGEGKRERVPRILLAMRQNWQ